MLRELTYVDELIALSCDEKLKNSLEELKSKYKSMTILEIHHGGLSPMIPEANEIAGKWLDEYYAKTFDNHLEALREWFREFNKCCFQGGTGYYVSWDKHPITKGIQDYPPCHWVLRHEEYDRVKPSWPIEIGIKITGFKFNLGELYTCSWGN